MGRSIDLPTTKQEEMFLPSEVANNIAAFSYIDKTGNTRALVSGIDIAAASKGRPPVLDAPRVQWPREFVLGCIIALFIIFTEFLKIKKPKLGRTLWGVCNIAFGAFFGIAGITLFFLTFFSNHDYTWHNCNIIFINPLLLAAIPLGAEFISSKNISTQLRCEKILRALFSYVFLGGIATLFLRTNPAYFQANSVTLALVLPAAFTLSFAFPPRKQRSQGKL
jgi:hypothetical protein